MFNGIKTEVEDYDEVQLGFIHYIYRFILSLRKGFPSSQYCSWFGRPYIGFVISPFIKILILFYDRRLVLLLE